MREKWVIGNWKMNGSLIQNEALLAALVASPRTTAKTAVCVPAVYLPQTQRQLKNTEIAWGAQDVSAYNDGAYTGQLSCSMLKEFGATIVIVGHSERRLYNAESSENVADKAKAAGASGLRPVICVGETLAERESGNAERIVAEQLSACAGAIRDFSQVVLVAYEPVWAIGTGKTASPDQAQQMHAFIRNEIARFSPDARSVPILYGGSVKPANAKELFAQPDIDGGLIGGASLVATDFLSIANALTP